MRGAGTVCGPSQEPEFHPRQWEADAAILGTVIPDQVVKGGSFFARHPTAWGRSGSCSHTPRSSGGPSVDKCPILQGLSESVRLGACPRQSMPLSFSLPCLGTEGGGGGGGRAERSILSPHHGAGALPLVVTGSLMLAKSLESHPAPVELCNLSKYLEFSVPQSLFWKIITEFFLQNCYEGWKGHGGKCLAQGPVAHGRFSVHLLNPLQGWPLSLSQPLML